MENVSRIDDLLTLNLFQCRDDFALEVLAGLLPQLIIYLVIISIWFAPRTASGVTIYLHINTMRVQQPKVRFLQSP